MLCNSVGHTSGMRPETSVECSQAWHGDTSEVSRCARGMNSGTLNVMVCKSEKDVLLAAKKLHHH